MNKRTLTIGFLLLLLAAGAALLHLRSRSLTGTLLGSSDLAISLSGPETVNPSGTVTYRVTVTNNGPDARNLITFRLFNAFGGILNLHGLVFNASLSHPSCTLFSGPMLGCGHQDAILAENQSRAFDIAFTAPSSCNGAFEMKAQLDNPTTETADTDSSNNISAIVTTTVACSVDERVQNLADTNHDGIVTVREMRKVLPAVIRAVMMQIVVTGFPPPPPDLRYDITGDGTLTLEDMTETVRILRGMLN